MVLLEGLEASHIGLADSMNSVDWIVLTPLPASIFDLQQPLPEGPFYVVDHPEIVVRIRL